MSSKTLGSPGAVEENLERAGRSSTHNPPNLPHREFRFLLLEGALHSLQELC
jgi:hypothetical protein